MNESIYEEAILDFSFPEEMLRERSTTKRTRLTNEEKINHAVG